MCYCDAKNPDVVIDPNTCQCVCELFALLQLKTLAMFLRVSDAFENIS